MWGVGGKDEMSRHIIESHRISRVYRVGVITATSAYLIRPSFFDSHVYRDFDQAPDDIRHVDDIWLNGHASSQNISRYVVPSFCSHISVTQTHALENYLTSHHMSRWSANTRALKWFGGNWGDTPWYKFEGENGPIYKTWWTSARQSWLSTVGWLQFVYSFGLP